MDTFCSCILPSYVLHMFVEAEREYGKGKSSSTRLFFLEKIHFTFIPDGEMSLFMNLVIYSNAISETGMP